MNSVKDFAITIIGLAFFSIIKWWLGIAIATAFAAGVIVSGFVLLWKAGRRLSKDKEANE